MGRREEICVAENVTEPVADASGALHVDFLHARRNDATGAKDKGRDWRAPSTNHPTARPEEKQWLPGRTELLRCIALEAPAGL
jgi:hypothetical protein